MASERLQQIIDKLNSDISALSYDDIYWLTTKTDECEDWKEVATSNMRMLKESTTRLKIIERSIVEIWELTRSINHQSSIRAIIKVCKRVQQ